MSKEPKPSLIDLPEEMITDRCVLRRYQPGDGEKLFEALTASREHLKATMPWAHQESSSEDAEELIRKFHANWLHPRSDLTLGIFSLDGSRLLGGTGLHRIDWHLRSFEIGYWIRPEEEGKGIVTACARALCELAFGVLRARRVHIRCNADNERSAAVARRLGFVEEGRFLNATLTGYGEIRDLLSFGMTPELWFALKKS